MIMICRDSPLKKKKKKVYRHPISFLNYDAYHFVHASSNDELIEGWMFINCQISLSFIVLTFLFNFTFIFFNHS